MSSADTAKQSRGGAVLSGRPTRVSEKSLCVETQSREIMAILVHDVVADAFRLGLYDKPAERVVKANGVPVRRRTAV